jgi:nitrogen regulatory protein PII
VDDRDVETAAAAIIQVARTGKNGDGKIFIWPGMWCASAQERAERRLYNLVFSETLSIRVGG